MINKHDDNSRETKSENYPSPRILSETLLSNMTSPSDVNRDSFGKCSRFSAWKTRVGNTSAIGISKRICRTRSKDVTEIKS